ncbi:MAG: hypothetical protein WAO00_09225 [Chthoniobacterales bacterium]
MEFRSAIKERYGFAAWPLTPVARPLAEKRGFVPKQAEVRPFLLERRRALPDHRNAYIDFYHRADDPQVLFSVTVIEHQTPEEAHEALVDFLTTVMAPTLPATSEKGIEVGDVGFAGHAEVQTDVCFTRGTVFIRVQSIGDKEASVKELAEILDRQVRQHLAV